MLRLPDSVTMRDARETLRTLEQTLRRESVEVVAVDASGLQRFDSAALAVLLECKRMAETVGKGFTVQLAPPRLVELARLYGLDALLVPGLAVR